MQVRQFVISQRVKSNASICSEYLITITIFSSFAKSLGFFDEEFLLSFDVKGSLGYRRTWKYIWQNNSKFPACYCHLLLGIELFLAMLNQYRTECDIFHKPSLSFIFFLNFFNIYYFTLLIQSPPWIWCSLWF